MKSLQLVICSFYTLHAVALFLALQILGPIYHRMFAGKPLPALTQFLFDYSWVSVASIALPFSALLYNLRKGRCDTARTLYFGVSTVALGTLLFWTAILGSLIVFVTNLATV